LKRKKQRKTVKNKLFDVLSAVFLVRRCPLCAKLRGITDTSLCDDCLSDTVRMHTPLATVNPDIEIFSVFAYGGAFATAVKRYKNGEPSDHYIGKYFAELLSENVPEEFLNADLVCAVPKYFRYFKGFNPSAYMAKCFARRIGKDYEDILYKKRETKKQKQCRTPRSRRRNVRGSFGILPKAEVKNKTVLIIDDVCTTGATVGECARILHRHGARRVFALTLLHSEFSADVAEVEYSEAVKEKEIKRYLFK